MANVAGAINNNNNNNNSNSNSNWEARNRLRAKKQMEDLNSLVNEMTEQMADVLEKAKIRNDNEDSDDVIHTALDHDSDGRKSEKTKVQIAQEALQLELYIQEITVKGQKLLNLVNDLKRIVVVESAEDIYSEIQSSSNKYKETTASVNSAISQLISNIDAALPELEFSYYNSKYR